MLHRRADIVFCILFLLLTLFQLVAVYSSSMTLSADETHYWEWSRNLDIAYYSKGPLIAWLIAASRSLFGDSVLAVRMPAIVCYSLFSLLFWLFVRSLYGPLPALIAWVAQRSILIFAQMGFLMTTDAPVSLFWLLALVSGYHAVFKGRLWAWLFFGAAFGLGVWSKYTAGILYPSVILFLLLMPAYRRQLISVQFILGVVVALAFLFPVFLWNHQHGWVNFAHNWGHVVKQSGIAIRPGYIFELLAGQLGLVGPILFFGICYALYCGLRWSREKDPILFYFTMTSVPLAAMIALISLTKRVYANWPMPIYIGGLLALVHLLLTYGTLRARFASFIRPGILFSLIITLVAHLPLYGVTFFLPGKILPMKKLVGWDVLGQKVGSVLEQRKNSEGEEAFIISHAYGVASAISYYTESQPYVYCAKVDGRRMNQYDIWDDSSRWQELKGRDALIVLRHEKDKAPLVERFSSIEAVPPLPYLQIYYSGTLLREFYFYWGKNFDGTAPPPPLKR